MDSSYFGALLFEFNEHGMAQMNVMPDIINSKYMVIPSQSEYVDLTMSSFRKIKDCDKNNQQKSFVCVNEFISDKMSKLFLYLSSN